MINHICRFVYIYLSFHNRDSLTLFGRLKHTNTSNADATNVTVHYRTPVYSSFIELRNWTDVEPLISVMTPGDDIQIQVYKFKIIFFIKNSLEGGFGD